MFPVPRRQFLRTSAAMGFSAAAGLSHPTRAAESEPVAFCVVGDTHFFASKDSPEEMNADSAGTNARLVDTLNALRGSDIPATAGGGQTLAPRGLIHAGDLIDSGDKAGAIFTRMQETEWNNFGREFGLTGGDGRLKMPVYEVHGNHDGPRGEGIAIDGIRTRNKTRPGVKHRSHDGLHYSWDWGPVHFVNLGIVVGSSAATMRKRRYNPLDSLDFLIADLQQHAADGKPVVITHHIDIARYTGTCDAAAAPDAKEWDACDVQAFHQALAKVRIAAIFYGHTHKRDVLRWDGQSMRAEKGIPVFNVDNSAHFAGPAQAFFYVEVHPTRTLVRERFTKDAWATADWTPESWSAGF